MKTQKVKLSDIKTDPLSDSLVESEDMKPYLELLGATIKGEDTESLRSLIRDIPLEKRYIWRIVSALKWGLVDCDSETARIDKETLKPEQVRELQEELQLRFYQLSQVIKAFK